MSEATNEHRAQLDHYKQRAQTFKVITLFAALIFVVFAGLTIWDLFKEIMGGMFGSNTYFGWSTLNRMFRFKYYLLGSGLGYLVFGSIQEHYDEKLYQASAALEALQNALLAQQQHDEQAPRR
jgi:hypothetical protein